jgi:hypothetical protein
VLTSARLAGLAAGVIVAAASLAGCAQFDKALGQQWIVVTFAPNTTVATAKHVVSVCSHIPNLPLIGTVKPDTGDPGIVDEVNFNSTKASTAEMAELETCMNKFPNIVQGFTQQDDGDN